MCVHWCSKLFPANPLKTFWGASAETAAKSTLLRFLSWERSDNGSITDSPDVACADATAGKECSVLVKRQRCHVSIMGIGAPDDLRLLLGQADGG